MVGVPILRQFWKAGVGVILGLLHVCLLPVCDAEKPNVIVFLVDDMGPLDTSVPFMTDEKGVPQKYPLNDFYRTPGMERLAETGIRFNTFYCMSVCSPTRTSLLTGQNAARHHVTQWIRSEENNRGPNGPP
ncbi:MAG: sulfatase-like hydrolase/transferase, partial [Pirellulales bacterium]